MRSVPKSCPICGGDITVTQMHCAACDTTFSGRFAPGRFANLTPEQWDFIEMFVRFEGKLKHMGAELNLSYPTVRNRLHEIIRALGYTPGQNDSAPSADPRNVLDKLETGEITAEEAVHLLDADK